MSTLPGHHKKEATAVDMKLEVVVVPVSDMDQAKDFYQALGWRLDTDFAAGELFPTFSEIYVDALKALHGQITAVRQLAAAGSP